ncbi:hypothetical protein GGR54DRAFT_640496 [Hypoxylon sp. NC1633]|nr:hypothetical protein GGR54DRAFT_640496 [Hypoxylon sp. NC1633]
MASTNLKTKPLPSGAESELDKISAWLRDSDADFQSVSGINICRNTTGLTTTTADLLKHFLAEIKPAPSQNRVTAIHFDQHAVVPVEKGWAVDLIPVHIEDGVATVGSEQLDLGNYIHLNEESRVTGNFYAILLLSELA